MKGFTLLRFKKWIFSYSGYQTDQFFTPSARPLWKRKLLQHSTTDPSSAWLASLQLLGQSISENNTTPIRPSVQLFHSVTLKLSPFNWKAAIPWSAPDFGQCLCKRRLRFSSSNAQNPPRAEAQGSRHAPDYLHWLTPLNTRGDANPVQSFPIWKADPNRNSYLHFYFGR